MPETHSYAGLYLGSHKVSASSCDMYFKNVTTAEM